MRAVSIACLLLFAAAPDAGTEEDASARTARLIVEGARKEAAKETPYVMQYVKVPYPGGDVPPDTGVCTDLIVRALRNAGLDLQKAVHEDRVANAAVYPTYIWAQKRADANIDHRRCQNLIVWFRRHAKSLTTEIDEKHLGQWRPGDVVFFGDANEFPWHVAVVSDKTENGMPYVIDSLPPKTSETHWLSGFGPINGHFRLTSDSR